MEASLGLNPKNGASNIGTSSSTEARLTYSGLANSSAVAPAAVSSASVSERIDSMPSCRFCQNSCRLRAPGNRPAMPTIAIFEGSHRLSLNAAGPICGAARDLKPEFPRLSIEFRQDDWQANLQWNTETSRAAGFRASIRLAVSLAPQPR